MIPKKVVRAPEPHRLIVRRPTTREEYVKRPEVAKRIKRRKLLRDNPLEAKIEERSVKLAKNHGWVARKMNGLGFRSWPDRLFLPPRNSTAKGYERFWVEFKRIGEVSTPDQVRVQKDLRARGEDVYECDSVVAFEILLTARMGGTKNLKETGND